MWSVTVNPSVAKKTSFRSHIVGPFTFMDIRVIAPRRRGNLDSDRLNLSQKMDTECDKATKPEFGGNYTINQICLGIYTGSSKRGISGPCSGYHLFYYSCNVFRAT